jgi:hypothetical protein
VILAARRLARAARGGHAAVEADKPRD